MYVTGFKYQASATDKYAEITTGSSTPVLVAVMELSLFDTDMNVVATKQYTFPRTKISGDVTISGKTEKTKNVDNIVLKILKDKSLNYLGRIAWIYPDVV